MSSLSIVKIVISTQNLERKDEGRREIHKLRETKFTNIVIDERPGLSVTFSKRYTYRMNHVKTQCEICCVLGCTTEYKYTTEVLRV